MFFHHRATQAEYFDSLERPEAEIAESYRCLARVNRLFHFAEPFQRLLPRLLENQCQSLSILDLGAGDGSLAKQLTEWAAKKGWTWQFTNVDLSLAGLRLGRNGARVAGSALALPFADNTFDAVIASQMTHHLMSDSETVQHLREAWRVARRGVLIADLNRSPLLYGVIWLLFLLRPYPKHFREDGLLSIKRSFRPAELQQMAGQAGLRNAQAYSYYGARVIVQARKGP